MTVKELYFVARFGYSSWVCQKRINNSGEWLPLCRCCHRQRYNIATQTTYFSIPHSERSILILIEKRVKGKISCTHVEKRFSAKNLLFKIRVNIFRTDSYSSLQMKVFKISYFAYFVPSFLLNSVHSEVLSFTSIWITGNYKIFISDSVAKFLWVRRRIEILRLTGMSTEHLKMKV